MKVRNVKCWLTLAVLLVSAAFPGIVSAGEPVAVAPAPAQGGGGTMVAESPTSSVTFSATLGAGYLTGESNEMVYWPSLGNHKASELTWKTDNLYMIGLAAKLEVNSWFAIHLDGWFKATDGDGSMEDYDWTVVGSDWTNYSSHGNTDVTDGSLFDINTEVSFYTTPTWKCNAIVGYKRDDFGWEARGGEYVYSENGLRNISGVVPVNILSVSYEQTMTSFYIGTGFGLKYEKFHFTSRIIYSPFVSAEATDHHYLRNIVISDDFDDGDLIAFDIEGSYLFTEKFALELAYSYQKYDNMQGDSKWYYNDFGAVINYPNGGGMDQQSSMLSMSLQYTF